VFRPHEEILGWQNTHWIAFLLVPIGLVAAAPHGIVLVCLTLFVSIWFIGLASVLWNKLDSRG
jgi:hypothetical protein